MNILIKYNKSEDEFSSDLNLEERLKNYITSHFNLAYEISKSAPIYLVGGAIRDLILAKHPKDLDFVVMGKENIDLVLSIFKKHKITYEFNKLGGFQFDLDGTTIDLWLAEDLFSAIQYNVDGLLFDLKGNLLVSLTFNDFMKNGLREVNNENNIEKGRVKKLVEFEKQFRNK